MPSISQIYANYARHRLPDNRLSLTIEDRGLLAAMGGFTAGAILGVSNGGKMAALRFRAENAHRMPTTSTGWYQYHKSKHYNVALEGMNSGMRLGLRLPVWAIGFIVIEDSVDRLRGMRDAFSTVVAGLTLSGIFSVRS